MHCHPFTQADVRRRRLAFTLIELLVVIMIIGILTALLMAGFSSAVTTARVAAVVSEIENFEKAIASFKLEYGIEPPSLFVLHESGVHWAGSSPDERLSRQIVRKLWPGFLNSNNVPQGGDDFDGDGVPDDDDGDGILDFDFNRDGDGDDDIILNGAECLVFFLGGRTIHEDANGNGVFDVGERRIQIGFSSNPANPFEITATLSNRTDFHEFDPAKLVDVDNDFAPEYLDEIPGQSLPYLYFSSYDGAGYDSYGPDDTRGTIDDETLTISGNVVGLEDAYYEIETPRRYYQSKSFQIISPGFDGVFYADTDRPTNPAGTTGGRGGNYGLYNGDSAIGLPERDNITNFKGSRLN